LFALPARGSYNKRTNNYHNLQVEIDDK